MGNKVPSIFKGITYAIRPHPKAPRLSTLSDGKKIVEQIVNEVKGGNFSTSNEELRGLIRECGFVNLWFFLKFIAGAYGPYDKLNSGLHLDLTNFRQSDYCMLPGTAAAVILGRGFYKSSAATHGADQWELLRNPDLRIVIINNLEETAQKFKRLMQATFLFNPVFKWLYGEYVPDSQLLMNSKRFVLPNRTKVSMEDNVTVLSMDGTGEGMHFDLIDVDDPTGLRDLNSQHVSSATMESKRYWFKTNTRTLADGLKVSRVHLKATRYAYDDVVDLVWNDCKKVIGYQEHGYELKEDGRWVIYYHLDRENGELLFPENFDNESLDKMAREDYMAYAMNYANDPSSSGIAEWTDLGVGNVTLGIDAANKIQFDGFTNERFFLKHEDGEVVFLEDCDMVMALDPAATDDKIGTRTSKSAIVVWALDCKGRYYLVKSRAGYFNIRQVLDLMFDVGKGFYGYIRGTLFEKNGYQKILKDLLYEEEVKKGLVLNAMGVSARDAKLPRIRIGIGRPLRDENVFVCMGEGLDFLDEAKRFPTGTIDVLDASAMAFKELVHPEWAQDGEMGVEEIETIEDLSGVDVYDSPYVTGY